MKQTKEELITLLKKAGMVKTLTGNRYFPAGTYYLSHGEYSCPDFKIRKVRGEDDYYIHVNHYYYRGTFNTPEDGDATEWVEEMAQLMEA